MSEESGSHSGVDTTTGERVIVVHTPSNPAVPTVAPPASKWDIIKSTATMVTAVAGACVVLYGAGDALFTRYAAAAEMKAEDAGRKAEEALTEVAAHKKEVGQRLDRLEQKMARPRARPTNKTESFTAPSCIRSAAPRLKCQRARTAASDYRAPSLRRMGKTSP